MKHLSHSQQAESDSPAIPAGLSRQSGIKMTLASVIICICFLGVIFDAVATRLGLFEPYAVRHHANARMCKRTVALYVNRQTIVTVDIYVDSEIDDPRFLQEIARHLLNNSPDKKWLPRWVRRSLMLGRREKEYTDPRWYMLTAVLGQIKVYINFFSTCGCDVRYAAWGITVAGSMSRWQGVDAADPCEPKAENIPLLCCFALGTLSGVTTFTLAGDVTAARVSRASYIPCVVLTISDNVWLATQVLIFPAFGYMLCRFGYDGVCP